MNKFKILKDELELMLRTWYARLFPKYYSERLYWNTLHRRINWKNPQDYNEKIQYLKFYSDTSRWAELADKYKVRDYVVECGFGDILNELYAKFDSPEDIDIANLPDSFVMKANDRCGGILIVEDKGLVSNDEMKVYYRKVFKTKYGVLSAEPHYLKIDPCIIVEKLLKNRTDETGSLIDYKFHCFRGEVKYILVCFDRDSNNDSKTLIYDKNWVLQPQCVLHSIENYPKIEPPVSLKYMIQIAEVLSKPFPLVRVDFYEIDEKPIFGELTFTPAAGMDDDYTIDFLRELGSYVKL